MGPGRDRPGPTRDVLCFVGRCYLLVPVVTRSQCTGTCVLWDVVIRVPNVARSQHAMASVLWDAVTFGTRCDPVPTHGDLCFVGRCDIWYPLGPGPNARGPVFCGTLGAVGTGWDRLGPGWDPPPTHRDLCFVGRSAIWDPRGHSPFIILINGSPGPNRSQPGPHQQGETACGTAARHWPRILTNFWAHVPSSRLVACLPTPAPRGGRGAQDLGRIWTVSFPCLFQTGEGFCPDSRKPFFDVF